MQRLFLKSHFLLLPVLLALIFSGSTQAQDIPWPTDGWQTSTPEAQDMDSEKLAAMFENVILKDNLDIRSVLVIRNGYLVLEAYAYPYDADTVHIINSVTKSVNSTLIGIAIDKDSIEGVEQPLLGFFPERREAIPNLDAQKEAITLEDMLMMASGLECRDSYLYRWQGLQEMFDSDDPIQYMLDLPMDDEPGSEFEYCNGGSYTLAAIVQATTGMTALEFAEENLFAPLNITDVVWPEIAGVNPGWGDMHMKPPDMAKIGYLFLNNGQWEGEQIVSAEWVKAATSPQIQAGTLSDFYGYQWWVDEDGFYLALGYAGQYIAVVPDLNLVAVFTSSLQDKDFFVPYNLLDYYIIPAAESSDALPENPEGQAQLEAVIHTFQATEPESRLPLPEIATSISGKTYELENNRYEWETITFLFDESEDEAVVVVNEDEMPFGLDNLFRQVEIDGDVILTKGHWQDEQTLILNQAILSYNPKWDFRIVFSEDGQNIEIRIQSVIAEITTHFNGEITD